MNSHSESKKVAACGILNIHKPPGCTSRDVVNQVQRFFGRKVRVGHAGTLDPMATGVLLVAVGRATKLIPVIHEYSKTYVAGFTFGQTSDTDDSTGNVSTVQVTQPVERQAVEDALQLQIGAIMQTPPAFSAVKVQGKRAYAVARKGQQVEIKPRQVQVHEIEILEYQFPTLKLRIRCGSGTYIRSIARDVGLRLGIGGLMHELQRTVIGPYSLEDAIDADTVRADSLKPAMSIFACDRAGEPTWSRHCLSNAEIQQLRNGHPLVLQTNDAARLVAVTSTGDFAAILRRSADDHGRYRAEINWVPQWFNS